MVQPLLLVRYDGNGNKSSVERALQTIIIIVLRHHKRLKRPKLANFIIVRI